MDERVKLNDKIRRIDIARLAILARLVRIARIARWLVQVIALTNTAYHMTLALAKYLSNSTIPSVEYKDVNDTKLPAFIAYRQQQDQFGIYGINAIR